MTPLSKALARFLPADWVLPALAVVYAVLLVAVFVSLSTPQEGIIYVDIHSAR